MHPNKLEFARSVQVVVFNLCTALREEAQARQKAYRNQTLTCVLAGILCAGALPLWGAVVGLTVAGALAVRNMRRWQLSRRIEKVALHRVKIHGSQRGPTFCLPLF